MYFIYSVKRFVCRQLLVFFLAFLGGSAYVVAQSANQDSTVTGGVVDTDGGQVPAGGSQPVALDPAKVEAGKTLFNNNCTACHALSDEVLVGPGLKGINERRPQTWLINWIRNSQKVIQSGDKYAVDLFNKFNKTVMPAYDFSDEQIVSILQYIDQQNTGGGANTAAGGATDGQAVPSGGGASVTPGEGGGGISSQYFTIIIGALLVILLLILLVLVLIVSLLGKFLSERKDLPEEDRELVNQRIDVKKVVNSNAFKGGVALIFLLIVGKVAVDSLFNIGISQGYAPKQPIAYSHKLHAGQYQIDCSYCHTTVYKAKSASIPSANICMNCHNAIQTSSPEIKKIYDAIENDRPIEWVRVHNLPDFAYFNHSQHTNVGGIECQNCHGEIQTMEVVQQVSPLTMGWCIDCHRKTQVNTEGNDYYDKLLALHNSKEPLKVANIGGLECSKCHY
ncbi:cytochrome c3 family protein [Rhodocytophaga aerolata]|uniref:Cytochrome c3 family protein n=1 Tax=Rhodocytophaga aerolata TaxID=455078 RepID=A0ABT8R615_9BACT|nr:cytochrome c3 family protein [Rhodocytophaga aerolata]MDO1447539.1 cytochrome c3 family protein [Rhodocytophaga aerolata]